MRLKQWLLSFLRHSSRRKLDTKPPARDVPAVTSGADGVHQLCVPELGLCTIASQDQLDAAITCRVFREPFENAPNHTEEFWFTNSEWLPNTVLSYGLARPDSRNNRRLERHDTNLVDNWNALRKKSSSGLLASPGKVHVDNERYTGGRRVTLGRDISGTSSTVWTVEEYPDLVVRYTVWCTNIANGGRQDPTLKMYFFQRLVARAYLAPQIYFMSPEFSLPSERNRMGGFVKLRPAVPCSHTPNSPVRMVVMERLGDSLNRLVDHVGRFDLSEAVKMVIAVVRLLEKIHTWFGIVHGDIHPGNIVLSHKAVNDVQQAVASPLKLIDFEMAKVVGPLGDYIDETTDIDELGIFYMHSPWEMQTHPQYTYRDDLFRAMQLLSHFMHGSQFFLALKRVFHRTAQFSTGQLVNLKKSGDIFELASVMPTDSEPNPFSFEQQWPEDPGKVRAVREKLGLVMQTILILKPGELPDYDRVVHLLTDLLYT